MASSGRIESSLWNGGIKYYFDWSQSKDTANNRSIITCKHYVGLASGWALSISSRSSTCNVGGDSKTFSISGINASGTDIHIATTTHTVYHSSSGSASASMSSSFPFRATISGKGYLDTLSASGSVSLDPIYRNPSTISTPTTGTIGSAIKISIARQSSALKHTLTYNFEGLTGTIVSKTTGASYDWTIPTDFYNQIPAARSAKCELTCETFTGSTSLGKTTYSFTAQINEDACQPTLSPTIKDVNSVSLAITNNDQIMVRNLSNAQINSGASVKNGATIRTIKIACGSNYLTTTNGTINAVEDNVFIFTLIDSRGLMAEQEITMASVDYLGVTCNFEGEQPNINGEFSFSISGNFFNGEFAGKQNTLAVAYRYKKENDSYTDWISITPELGDNYYFATVNLTGLDIKSGYYFQAKATDIVMTATSREKYVKYEPVFDWGKNDFAVNVPLYIQGRRYDENRTLWEGAWYMNASQTINLPESISEQRNGIVLVFSYYDGGALDHSINTFFISKNQIEAFENCGHTFLMGINAGFSSIGAKYLYFTDTTITGHEGNISTGTNSGITFANNNYVLRMVIGV